MWWAASIAPAVDRGGGSTNVLCRTADYIVVAQELQVGAASPRKLSSGIRTDSCRYSRESFVRGRARIGLQFPAIKTPRFADDVPGECPRNREGLIAPSGVGGMTSPSRYAFAGVSVHPLHERLDVASPFRCVVRPLPGRTLISSSEEGLSWLGNSSGLVVEVFEDLDRACCLFDDDPRSAISPGDFLLLLSTAPLNLRPSIIQMPFASWTRASSGGSTPRRGA